MGEHANSLLRGGGGHSCGQAALQLRRPPQHCGLGWQPDWYQKGHVMASWLELDHDGWGC